MVISQINVPGATNGSLPDRGRGHSSAVVNPLMGTGNYSAISNNMKLVHWPLMDGLLHLIQWGVDWAEPQRAQVPHRCTICNSPPINGQRTITVLLYNDPLLCGLNVLVEGLRPILLLATQRCCSPAERSAEDLETIYDELLHIKALSHLSTMVKRELAGVLVFEAHWNAGKVCKHFRSLTEQET